MSLGIIVGKKITILFQFSNGKQLAAAGAGWAVLQWPATTASACAAGRAACSGCGWPHRLQRPAAPAGAGPRCREGQELRAMDFRIFQSTAPTNPRWSAKRDMYSRDGARSAIGMRHSSWNQAKWGFSLFGINMGWNKYGHVLKVFHVTRFMSIVQYVYRQWTACAHVIRSLIDMHAYKRKRTYVHVTVWDENVRVKSFEVLEKCKGKERRYSSCPMSPRAKY